MLNVTLYTRKDCHLCDQAKADLASLQDKYPHRLVEVNIESDPVLHARFFDVIPVVEVGPYNLKAPITRQALEMTLGAASDRKSQLDRIGDPEYRARVEKGRTVSGGDRFSFWMSKRYLTVLNVFVLFYVGLPFLAPVLMKAGAEIPARILYRMYSPLCHQFGFRSFFLFGEQAYYPLEEAGLKGVKTFDEVSGIQNLADPSSYTRFEARRYVGDETVGYKVALCERDVAIYSAMLFFGLLFAATGRRFKSLHWLAWVLIGLAPIGLDGFSQLFSQFQWEWLASILPYRESTPFLRLLTGALFGFATAWFAYPNIEASMNETRQYFIKKFAVNGISR
jgi:uncharacterized membrane protein